MSQGSSVHSLGRWGEQDFAWRAATLAERVASAAPSRDGADRFAADVSARDDALAPWARAFAFGDLSALLRRLAWDGVLAGVAARALSDHPEGAVDAAWVEWLPRFLCGSAIPDADSMPAPSPEPPFIEAWSPLLLAARTTLGSRVASVGEWFSPGALRALERHLVRQVAAVGELALFETFTTGVWAPAEPTKSRYGAFVGWLLGGGWANVFQEYPVLARQLAQLAQEWVDGIARLICHLDADRTCIEEAFGASADRVDEIEPGLSDRHGGGLVVSRVVFSSGLCLAYKPRDVSLEAAFHRLATWLTDAGLDSAPPAARVVDRGDHGWVQWVDQTDFCSDDAVTNYFRRAGSLACLVHILGAVDLHHENLVASALGPVLIDGEMLLQPLVGCQAAEEGGDGDDGAGGQAGWTCLWPGLVSLTQIDGAGRASDIGGLQPASERTSAVGRRRWRHLRSDDVAFTLDRSVVPTPRNDVRRQGVLERPASHAAAVCAGFEQTYRFVSRQRPAFLAADGLISWFAACSTRVLFRPSDQYGALQQILAAPRYQRRGVDRSLAIETLARAFCRDVERPRLWSLLRDERLSLERLEIPRQAVAACGTALLARDGATVDGYITRSGCDAVRLRLLAMGDGDLDYQLDELRAGLSVHDALPPHAPLPSVAEVPTGVGSTSAGPRRIPPCWWRQRRRSARPSSPALARCRVGRSPGRSVSVGRTSIAAAAAFSCSCQRWRRPPGPHGGARPARGAFAGIRTANASGLVSPLQGCTGRPSAVYALTLAGQLLDDRALVDAALALARGIPAQAIDDDRVLDVEGGCAGTLLSRLAAVVYGAPGIGRVMRALVDYLLDTAGPWRPRSRRVAGRRRCQASSGVRTWRGRNRLRPREVAGPPADRVVETIRSAWAYERRVFGDNHGTWPTIRGDGSVRDGRLVPRRPGNRPRARLQPAVVSDEGAGRRSGQRAGRRWRPPAANRDHLCCGNLGRADILLTVGRTVRPPGGRRQEGPDSLSASRAACWPTAATACEARDSTGARRRPGSSRDCPVSATSCCGRRRQTVCLRCWRSCRLPGGFDEPTLR